MERVQSEDDFNSKNQKLAFADATFRIPFDDGAVWVKESDEQAEWQLPYKLPYTLSCSNPQTTLYAKLQYP